ncbi:glycosyltransferase family 2 protein [Benzoatithermus flavus]|uniref:Glycosyltransferase family A protein n=1 Tax=Benzoatithermus flavus TaxID=3108223 RepID=A0ABU8XVR1_9PROT
MSIGLPVFNGENFLEDAARSVLAQTFDDLELVICDNASTDRTGEIARDLAASDPRVRYFRNERNLGAAPNYNRTWHESRGEYFKWLSHDDRLTPTYVEATVTALDAAPDAVLCNSVVDYIDEHGIVFATYDSDLGAASGPDPAARFAAMVLRSHSCVDFFGMTRRRAMEGSLLHASFHGADRAFLAQMALRGRLLQLPEHLVQMREHRQRYTRQQADARARALWHDSSGRKPVALPTLNLYHEYMRLVRAESLTPSQRRRCYRVLAQWWWVNWNLVRVGTDAIALLAPGVVGRAERLKARLFGAAPGHFAN